MENALQTIAEWHWTLTMCYLLPHSEGKRSSCLNLPSTGVTGISSHIQQLPGLGSGVSLLTLLLPVYRYNPLMWDVTSAPPWQTPVIRIVVCFSREYLQKRLVSNTGPDLCVFPWQPIRFCLSHFELILTLSLSCLCFNLVSILSAVSIDSWTRFLSLVSCYLACLFFSFFSDSISCVPSCSQSQKPRMILYFWSSCLYLSKMGIIGMNHHFQILLLNYFLRHFVAVMKFYVHIIWKFIV